MALEDILGALVNSRGTSPSQQNAGTDAMTNLVGSLLGGGQPQSSGSGAQQQTGVSDMMGMLESVIGGQAGANDPVVALLMPFVSPLAKKANIPTDVAMVVISFVVHKMLAHHPASGRDSNSFNLDTLLQQLGTGSVNTDLLRSSGMINELSQKTGLTDAQTEQALQTAFSLVGTTVGNMASKGSSKPSSAGAASKNTSKPSA